MGTSGRASTVDDTAITIWLEVHSLESAIHRDSVVAALHHQKVEVVAHPGDGAPGVVLFDALDQGLLSMLHELSRAGLDPVVAVAASRQRLPPSVAWAVLEAGASDAMAWDASDDPAEAIAARLRRWAAVDRLVASPTVRDYLLGASPTWIRFVRQVVEVAAFSDAPVLIIGESGTGKELVARMVHILDPRPDKKDLIVLDSTTIVPELSGSEFFGHERGAFTSAMSARDGAFALADHGTLFLDEVGELPLELQARLLRVVQEHTYKRVGGNTWMRTEFRLVCATNRNLPDEVACGRFRRDFFYRIAGWTCHAPALRERREDIALLARHFLRQACGGREPPALDGPALDYLMCRDYPGNIRDLQQLVMQMSLRHTGAGPMTLGDLPDEARRHPGELREWTAGGFDHAIARAVALGVGLREIGRAATEAAVHAALVAEAGNLRRAARRLGVTDRALQLRRARRGEGSGAES